MIGILEKSITCIIQQEGKKFLSLSSGYNQAIHSDKENNSKVGSLYIHIPYCRILCPYCSFNRYLYNESEAKSYFEALKKETDLYKEFGFQFTHLYIGGGTPTVNMDLLIRYISYVKSIFSFQQISMETNPSDLNETTIQQLVKMKVQRLSIGVQSFNDDLLKQMGRFSHTASIAKEAVQKAKGHFDTVNIDLMFNFPSQSIDSFREDIKTFRSLGIEQVTFYPLMPSPHKKTKLEQQFNQIKTDREYEFYQFLLKEMLPEYSISTAWCFSKGNKIIDEYIIEDEDYVGMGAGAVSFLNGTFLVNTFSPQKYIEMLSKNNLPIIMSKKSTRRDYARYSLLTNLFGMKMDLIKYRVKFQNTLWWEILALRIFGIVKKDGDFLYTTRKGMYYIGIMMKNFFATLNHLREYCIERKL